VYVQLIEILLRRSTWQKQL